MIVISLTAVPVGLRGDLTRWLFEISPGVFVGNVTARVRDKLWDRVTGLAKDGRATMVYSAQNEQHLAFKVHRSDWIPEDIDGLTLVRRPEGTENSSVAGTLKTGWSSASKYRKARKFQHK
jgi:CRISPR-associated protein Cas2